MRVPRPRPSTPPPTTNTAAPTPTALAADADLAVVAFEAVPGAPGTSRPPDWFTARWGVGPGALLALREARARRGQPPAHRRREFPDTAAITSGPVPPHDVTARHPAPAALDLDDDLDPEPRTHREATRAARVNHHPDRRPRPTVARMS